MLVIKSWSLAFNNERKEKAILFESTKINGIKIKNRFVRSATHEAMAGLDGKVNDQLLACMAELARGDVGLIITGPRPCDKRRSGRPPTDEHIFQCNNRQPETVYYGCSRE